MGPSLAPLEETMFVNSNFGDTEALQVSVLGRSIEA